MAQEIAKAYVQIIPTTKGITDNLKSALDDYDNEFGKVGEKAGATFADKLKGAILKAGIGAAIGKTIGDAIKNGANFEQLWGGAEKIFAGMDTSKILGDATQAYKDLGMSANQYLEKINDVGAAFKSSMGSQAGYDTARKGLQAISDYATGTGKDLNVLSDKFAMITRSTSSYQSIADQFSGILPATSQAFLDQAKACGDLSDQYTSLNQVPIAEYQQAVASALERGVEALNLTGNTAKEASSTLSGSVQEMKAAWENFTTSLVVPEIDSSEALQNLIDAFGDVIDNITPMLEELAPNLVNGLADAFTQLAPKLLNILGKTIKSVISAIPQMFKNLDLDGVAILIIGIGSAFTKIVPAIKAAKEAIIAFNLACEANPYILLAVAIAAVGAAAVAVAPKLMEAFDNTKLGQALGDQIEKIVIEMELAGGKAEWFKMKMSQALDGLENSAKTALSGLKSQFDEVYGMLPDGLKNADSEILRGMKSIVGHIKNALDEAASSVLSWGNDLASKAKEAINRMVSGILSTIAELPQKIKEAGIQMAQGLLQGFESKIDAVKNKITNAVAKITDGIKDVLNIHSPSRVWADEIGSNMALGLSMGFTQVMPKVNAEIKNDLDSTLRLGNAELRSALKAQPSRDMASSNDRMVRDLETAIRNITVNTNVRLEGDANKFFKAMQNQGKIYNNITGRSAFA